MKRTLKKYAQSTESPKGFTILFAVIVASLLLAVGFTIFDITFKQVTFSSIVRNSNYALYAADAGYECAQYWDTHAGAGQEYYDSASAFATSSDSLRAPAPSGVTCVGVDITTLPPPQIPWGEDPQDTQAGACSGGWCVAASASAATTTFELKLPQGNCAIVQVAKVVIGASQAILYASRGYNSCNLNDPNRVERVFETF